MNATLLRASERYADGCRSWAVPGTPNRVRVVTASCSMWPGAMSISWPYRKPDGEWIVRSVRLDWHRPIAKQAIREILASATAR